MSVASSTHTRLPASARQRAARKPLKPEPIMATSTAALPLREAVAGASGAVARHNDSGKYSFTVVSTQ